jgi:AcrR family transcriptional regulator
MSNPTAVNLASLSHSIRIIFFIRASPLVNVATVNINIIRHVDIVNMRSYHTRMARKRGNRYHHGDLSRALLQEALRIIEKGGVSALTLRGVGEKLGVSRTALYRHFADKSALLAAVATQGFRTLRLQTQQAWDAHGGGREGLEAMGVAYVRFAVAHPSHYRVMFGGFVRDAAPDAELAKEGAGAFQTLVDAIVAQQNEGRLRDDNPLALAQYIWANVHGIAMLAIDGQLKQPIEDVIKFANERMRTGIESTGQESGSLGVDRESGSPKS